MEIKFIIGILIMLLILAITIYFLTTSYDVFGGIIEWIKGIG